MKDNIVQMRTKTLPLFKEGVPAGGGVGNKELPASDQFSGGRFFVTCFKFYIF